MHLRTGLVWGAFLAVASLTASTARAQDLAHVLQKLDAAAEGFQTTSARVQFDTIQTYPVPDTDVMTGSAYYEHKGNSFRMAAHIARHNNRDAATTYIFSGGVLRVSDTGKERDAKSYSQVAKYESYLMLGFGASGKELEKKWTIKYLGTDRVDGVVTDKLELIARDPQVRKTIPKVTLWMDAGRGISLKQVFDEGDGMTRICHYTNIQVNQSLPKNAFSFGK
jgi:outer membrane lipoprotein-sorting protein